MVITTNIKYFCSFLEKNKIIGKENITKKQTYSNTAFVKSLNIKEVELKKILTENNIGIIERSNRTITSLTETMILSVLSLFLKLIKIIIKL